MAKVALGLRVKRYSGGIDIRTQISARMQNMTKIAQQAVRNIDSAVREPDERDSECKPGLGIPQGVQ
ncbi:MAG TPA: hypothetical protein EYP93_04725 [Gammaproteobacteria bacterium]|nr:hypothetical protein [Gammaproteobacteria bacterium]